jgi:hypothetical protein
MSKVKNHTLKLVKYSKLDDGNITIGVRGRYGSKILGQFSTTYSIPANAWDAKERMVKDTYEDEYKFEYDRLLEIKAKVKVARSRLAKGDMHWKSVRAFVLKRAVAKDDMGVLEYTKNQQQTKTRQYSTNNKHIQNIRAAENKLLPEHLTPLMFSYLNDPGICLEIEDAILNSNNKDSYKRQQLLSIQLMWRKKNELTEDKVIFDNIPPEDSNPTPKTPVTHNKYMRGITKINTILQMEALLFWLYSYCLNGLDGIDIVDLDKKNIVDLSKDDLKWDGKPFMPYHPDYDRFFSKKMHIQVVRHKSKNKGNKQYVVQTRLWNVLHTYYIKTLLKWCIAITKPDLVYKGDDPLRLFNFKVRDENRMQIKAGYDKWKDIQSTYSQILRKKIDATVQFTRATAAEVAQELDIDKMDIDSFLGHANERSKKVSASLGNYLREAQRKADTDHIFMMQEYDIQEKLYAIMDLYSNRTQVIDNKEYSYIPEELTQKQYESLTDVVQDKDNKNFIRTMWGLIKAPLTRWSKGEENEFQRLHTKYSKVTTKYNPDIKDVEDITISPDEYSDRFKELLAKKYRPQDKDMEKAIEAYEKEKASMEKVYDLIA